MAVAWDVFEGIRDRAREIARVYDIPTPLLSAEVIVKKDEVILSVNIPEANNLNGRLPKNFTGYPKNVAKKIFPRLEEVLPEK